MTGSARPIETVADVLEALDAVIARALEAGSRLGYFAAIYRKVTAKVAEGIATGFFDDGDRMQRLDVAFATRYLSALSLHQGERRPTRSWELAFGATTASRPIILQHLLLGINAHINLDLGIAAAETAPAGALPGLRRDFDRINEILAVLVGGIERDLSGVSPWIGLLGRIGGRHDDELVRFSIEVARTEAWRFATELAPIARPDWSGPIGARDAQVARLANVVLNPGLLSAGLLVIRARESNDVRRVIEALNRVQAPDLQVVEARVREERLTRRPSGHGPMKDFRGASAATQETHSSLHLHLTLSRLACRRPLRPWGGVLLQRRHHSPILVAFPGATILPSTTTASGGSPMTTSTTSSGTDRSSTSPSGSCTTSSSMAAGGRRPTRRRPPGAARLRPVILPTVTRPSGRPFPGGHAPVLHLVMPPWAGLGIHRTFGHRMPPMAMLVLAALARREGWAVRFVDLNGEELPTERPDLVGISVWTMLAPQAYELSDAYRRRGVPVVLGGVHPSMLPGEALRHADAVVVGEAESVFASVLGDAAAGRMAGVYQGSWGQMTSVPKVHEWTDLLESTPLMRYLPRNTLQTTRGCRFNCDFCSVIRINGRGSRHRDPEEVVEELRVLRRRGQRFGPFFHVSFLDDDLAADLEFAAALCEAIVRSGLKMSWAAQASIGLAGDAAMVDLVARAGCSVLFTGFESVSRETLVECNKKNRPHLYGASVKRLHDRKILVEGGFIFGFDHDEPGVFEETVDFVDKIGVDAAHFSILTPLPGTQTFARMAGDGRIVSYDWGEYDLYHAVFEPARMSRAQLQAGLWRAYRGFYGGSRRWRRWRRHVGMRLHPVVGSTITLTNADYARRFRPRPSTRPRYVAHPGDLEALLVTSSAPASQAITTAVAQFVAPPRARASQ